MALDEDFEAADLLVNTIGGQSGARFLSLTYDANREPAVRPGFRRADADGGIPVWPLSRWLDRRRAPRRDDPRRRGSRSERRADGGAGRGGLQRHATEERLAA